MRLLLAGLVLLAFAGCRSNAPAQRAEAPAETTAALPDTSAPADPADAVRRYYEALEARDYARAWSMWGDGGRSSGQTYAQFVTGFASTAHTAVTITDPGTIEGAAGSSYAEVGVRVDARTTDGKEQHFTGTYVVRRVNDVPGATPAQLRWHLNSAHLAPSP